MFNENDSTEYPDDYDIPTDDIPESPGLDALLDEAAERVPFKPNYTPTEGVRILRSRLYADEGGVATVIFAGTLDAEAVWIERGSRPRMSVYAEVTRGEDTDTVLRIALVPTGKRVPQGGTRIGGVKGTHAYLLSAATQARPAPAGTDAAWDDATATTPRKSRG